MLETEISVCSVEKFVLYKFIFPSFWHTLSKYSMKHQIYGQLCAERKSKIWCKNIHVFLRNCDFRVGEFYFDATCTYHH